MTTVNRVRDIDFWREAVLIVILVDHIPGNPLEHLTPRNFGLSDSAEAFVFLSGLSVGLIYLQERTNTESRQRPEPASSARSRFTACTSR